MLRCKQFSQRPNVVGQSSLHRGSDPKGLVYPAQVVVREMQRTRGLQIVQLLREGIRQTSEAPDGLANGHVLAFNVAGAHVARIGTP